MEIKKASFIKSKFSGKIINRVNKNDQGTEFLGVKS